LINSENIRFVKAIQTISECAALWHDTGKAVGQFQDMLKGKYLGKHDYRHYTLSHAGYRAYLALETNQLPDTLPTQITSRVPWKPCDKATLAECLVGGVVLTHHMKAQAFKDDHFTLNSDDFGTKVGLEDQYAPAIALGGLGEQWWQAVTVKQAQLKTIGEGIPIESLGCYFYCARAIMMLADHAASAAEKCGVEPAAPTGFAPGIHYAKSSPPIPLSVHLQSVMGFCESATSAFLTHTWPSVTRQPANTQKHPSGRFAWQHIAEERIREASLQAGDGFFGVMASATGSGKTQGGYRIMAALSGGLPRFTLGLGFGALAIQSGIEYRQEIGLSKEESAIFVGRRHSQARQDREASIKPLDASAPLSDFSLALAQENSESSADLSIPAAVEAALTAEQQHLLSVPIASMTVDHIMDAMQANRGTFVSAALRVATADLLIDEIDSFNLADLHAVGRLVYVSGLFGRKVVISSATVTPEIAEGLFNAYRAGYEQYQAANGSGRLFMGVFSNQGVEAVVAPAKSSAAFMAEYERFTTPIAEALKRQPAHRRKLTTFTLPKKPSPDDLSNGILKEVLRLAGQSHSALPGIDRYATGFVRFNFNKDAQSFLLKLIADHKALERDTGWCIRLNYYGGRLDTASRQYMEGRLSKLLRRKDDEFLKSPEMDMLNNQSNGRPVLYLIVTTSLIEIGRDYDMDFAILEPCSDMSIIQASGRVLRHRWPLSVGANISLMPRSFRSLTHTATKVTRWYGHRGPGVEQINPVTGSVVQLPARKPPSELFGLSTYRQGIHAGYRLTQPISEADRVERQALRAVLLSELPLSLACFARTPIVFAGKDFDGIRFRRSEGDQPYLRNEYAIVEAGLAVNTFDDTAALTLTAPALNAAAIAALLIKPPLEVSGTMQIPLSNQFDVVFAPWLGWQSIADSKGQQP
jgi:CRISPR-associated endonuclease/helicase Cas3